MAITDAQKRATYKYREKYEEIRVRVTKEEKAIIKEYAERQGVSVSQLVHDIIRNSIIDKN